MNFAFTEEEESFRREVRSFLAGYRDLDGFFRQGHVWPEVRAMFREIPNLPWTEQIRKQARCLRWAIF